MRFNESTSIILLGNEEILSTCGKSLLPWLVFHVCYTSVLNFSIVPLMITLIMTENRVWSWWYRDNRLQDEDFSRFELDQSKLAKLYRFVLAEIRLLCVYVSIAFLFTKLMSYRSIQLITICRWLIEASMIPNTIILIVGIYILDENQCLMDFNAKPLPKLVYMIKGTLFLLIRYIELHPSSPLNDLQTIYFYCFCNQVKLHQVPDHHRLWHFMHQ